MPAARALNISVISSITLLASERAPAITAKYSNSSGPLSCSMTSVGFGGLLTEDDKLVYVNNVIKGKLLESDVLVQQATNNTKE